MSDTFKLFSKARIEALDREIAALRALCDASGAPMGICRGPEHVLVYGNAALRVWLGRSTPEGMCFRDAAPDLVDGQLHEALDRVFGSGSAERVELERGQTLLLSPLAGGDGSVAGVVVVAPTAGAAEHARDQLAARSWELDMREAELRRREIAVTAREESLARRRGLAEDVVAHGFEQRASVVDSQVLGVISHELRTPVHVLLGFGDLLARELGDELAAKPAEYLLRMLGAVEILRQRVDDLLDLSRLEAGQLTLDLQPVAFGRMLEGAIATVRARAEGKGLSLVTEMPLELPIVLADRDKLGRAFVKLLDNAVKFTPAGGTITVRAHAWDDTLACEVADNGVGIAATALPHIFDPFARLDTSLSRPVGGCGLGLVLGRGYVEAHGGALSVDSIEGQGTTCRVALPLTGPGTLDALRSA